MKPSERCIEPNVFVRGELIRSATVNVTALAGVLDEFDARLSALESKDQPIGPSHDWRRKSEECYNAGHPCPDPWIPCKAFESPSDAVCARDAADIVRPPGHALGQPDGYTIHHVTEARQSGESEERRECWLLVLNSQYGSTEAYYGERPNWPGRESMGWTEHHLVELRDGEQIVPSGDMVVPMGSVVLSSDQAERIVRAVHGGPVESGDLRALGIEVES